MEKLFKIQTGDGFGSPIRSMGVLRAASKEEAIKIAEKYYKNEIETSGSYYAIETTNEDLKITFDALTERFNKIIDSQTKILN